jgi:hypothetical protein
MTQLREGDMGRVEKREHALSMEGRRRVLWDCPDRN